MSESCKIVLVGDAGTGKTCIISRYINNKFEKSQMATACPSFCTKTVTYPEYNKTLNLDIWDTAGQEIYRSISKLFYKGACVGILVYDVTNEKSFQSIKDYWYNELKDNTGENIIFNVVGNKIDLFEQENVNEDEAKNFAKSINAGFYLTSAKNNIDINKLFFTSGKQFIDPEYKIDLDNTNERRQRKESIKIKQNQDKQNNGGCC